MDNPSLPAETPPTEAARPRNTHRLEVPPLGAGPSALPGISTRKTSPPAGPRPAKKVRHARTAAAPQQFLIGFTGALGVLLAYTLYLGIRNAGGILVLVVIALFLAVGLNPAVVRLVAGVCHTAWRWRQSR